MKDYYRTLEIHPDASLEVMNKAYRTLVQKYHPDRYHSTDKRLMNERLREINEAYEVLSNETARRRYDARYRKAMAEGAFAPPPPGRPRGEQIRKALLWALGTFIVLQFLLRPLLMSPVSRIILLGLVVFLFIRLYLRPAAPS